MKKIIITLLIFNGLTEYTLAEVLTASQGLEKIKYNLTTSKKNKDEYDRNLQVVVGNLAEIKKNKEATLHQKKGVSSELSKNSDALKKLTLQEKELATLQENEKEKLKNEEKQIQQLQSLIEQIKKNQDQRQAIIIDYQNQLNLITNRKSDWKDRESKLKMQEAKTDDSLRKIASEESTWVAKKLSYEKELKTWSAESSRTQKLHDTYQGLSEGK